MFSAFIVFVLTLHLSGLHSQCYHCDQFWNAHCKVTRAGHFCSDGAKLTKLPGDPTVIMWDACGANEYKIEYVKEYCCVFSPETGCTVAFNPNIYTHYKPGNYCTKCTTKCDCQMDASTMLQPWCYLYLYFVLMCLLFILSN